MTRNTQDYLNFMAQETENARQYLYYTPEEEQYGKSLFKIGAFDLTPARLLSENHVSHEGTTVTLARLASGSAEKERQPKMMLVDDQGVNYAKKWEQDSRTAIAYDVKKMPIEEMPPDTYPDRRKTIDIHFAGDLERGGLLKISFVPRPYVTDETNHTESMYQGGLWIARLTLDGEALGTINIESSRRCMWSNKDFFRYLVVPATKETAHVLRIETLGGTGAAFDAIEVKAR